MMMMMMKRRSVWRYRPRQSFLVPRTSRALDKVKMYNKTHCLIVAICDRN